MHEHSFIQAIIGNIENKDSVKKVEIEVGELAGIDAPHLAEHLVEDTGWEVKTSECKAVVSCDCGFDGSPRILERLHDMVIFDCPDCGEIPQVKEGKDIKIIKVVYN